MTAETDLDLIRTDCTMRVHQLHGEVLREHLESDDTRIPGALVFGIIFAACDLAWTLRRPGMTAEDLANGLTADVRRYLGFLEESEKPGGRN